MNENCTPDPLACSCIGHTFPGVSHVAPCCDKPHVDQYRCCADHTSRCQLDRPACCPYCPATPLEDVEPI